MVAFGTGNVNTSQSASSTGRVVHDSHAVVAARRSLMRSVNGNVQIFVKTTISKGSRAVASGAGRFLYRNLLMFFSQTAEIKAKSIFEPTGDGGLLGLKSDITFHLYMNQLPKGAAQINSKL